MFSGQKIEIPRRARSCSHCERPFSGGDPYYSEVSEEGWERRDYCSSCWEEPLHTSSKTHWRATVPLKEEKAPLSKDRDVRAFQLLQMAIEEEEEEEAFILSLYLARKRVLVWRQEVVRKGDLPLIIYEVGSTEEMVTVKKFPLASLAVDELQHQLAQKFRVDG